MPIDQKTVNILHVDSTVFENWVQGDAYARSLMKADGEIDIGSGAAAVDTNLYRGAAGILQTDNTINAVKGYQDNSVALTSSFTFTPAASTSNICLVTITQKDGTGTTAAFPRPFLLWLSDAATGAGLTTTTASGAVAVGATGADFGDLTSKKAKMVQAATTGVYILSITDTGKTGFYVCAQCPFSGRVFASAQLVSGNYG